jgi:ceramide glucosyltransferase
VDLAIAGLQAVASWIGAVCFIAAALGATYACLSLWAMRRFMRRAPLEVIGFPSVTLLKPLRGEEPELYDNLQSFCRQDYPGPVQIVFGVQDPDDPAIAVVRRLQAAHPDVDIVLTVGAVGDGGNRKIANVLNMARHATAEVFVLSDSDVKVGPEHLRQIVGALQEPGVGLVTCLYRGRPTGTPWSTLAAMDIDFRFAPSVVMGLQFSLAFPCLGPTMALRRALLEDIGGFQHLSNFLADDYELGRAVRSRGYRVAFARGLIEHLCPESTLKAVMAHEFRWARTIRLIEPAGYFGSVITHFCTLALIGAIFEGFASWSLAALAAAAVLRLALVGRMAGQLGAGPVNPLLVPARDLLSFAVFIAAFCGDRVEWRGTRLQLSRAGEVTVC